MRRYVERAARAWKVPESRFLENATEYPSHAEVAHAVARGECKIGIASRAWAKRLGLRFRRFATESYGLLVLATHLGDPRVVRLCELAQSSAYQSKLREASGYDPRESGRVCYDFEAGIDDEPAQA
jgi:molybdate-binding protein